MASNKAMIGKCISKLMLCCIRLYQYTVSPCLGLCCRFEPSCSAYAMTAINMHGCFKGSGLGLWRILRCHPWQSGGFDPVPPIITNRIDN